MTMRLVMIMMINTQSQTMRKKNNIKQLENHYNKNINYKIFLLPFIYLHKMLKSIPINLEFTMIQLFITFLNCSKAIVINFLKANNNNNNINNKNRTKRKIMKNNNQKKWKQFSDSLYH